MRGKVMRTSLVGWTLSFGATFAAASAGCGGGAAEPVVQETAGEEDTTPRSTFTGTWNGERFDARWAALGWQWPGGWTVFLSDRPPNEGDVGLPVEATYVELRFGDSLQPVATEAGRTMTPFVTVAPNADGSTTPYEGEATSTVSLTDVTMTGTFDPESPTPQTVGTATLELNASFASDASHAAGELRGRGEIPIVFLGAPHAACMNAGPAPTDYTWAEEPNLRQAPSTPLHGNVRGRAFDPTSIFFERRTTSSEEEWAMMISTEPTIGSAGVDHETLTIRFDSRAAPRSLDARDGLGRWLLAGLRGPGHDELERRQRVRARAHALAGGALYAGRGRAACAPRHGLGPHHRRLPRLRGEREQLGRRHVHERSDRDAELRVSDARHLRRRP
jgi:hypothetical protein